MAGRWARPTLTISVVPARGGSEVTLGIYIKSFLYIGYRICMRRMPAKPVRTFCESDVLFLMSHLKLHFALHISHFSLHSPHTPHFTLHTPHFHFALHSSHSTLHLTLHTPHFTLHSSCPTLRTAPFTLHTSSHLSSSHLIPAHLFSSHLFSYIIYYKLS